MDFVATTTGTVLGSAAVVNGVASRNAGTFTVGSHNIAATYSGDSNFLSSSGTGSLTALAPASLSGTVFADFNTAAVGFWNNKNGQALINALNGGGSSHELGDWLAATFSNMYGADSSNDLAGKTNAYIAALFQEDFLHKGQKLDAQVLASVLSVYATNATLDNADVAARYGFTVSGYGAGTATVNVGSNGAAFGVANNTTLSVMDLLLATDPQAIDGLLYNGNTTKRNDADALYRALNQEGNI